MEQSWSCQTTKQFKLQTLGTFLFVAATNSQQPKVFLGRAVGKRTTFELFLFYYEFLGQHPGFSTSLLVDWPFLIRPVGENRVCQLPLAHRAYD